MMEGEAGRAWSRLPEDIGDDPEAYSKFIRDYGTHYFVQGKEPSLCIIIFL